LNFKPNNKKKKTFPKISDFKSLFAAMDCGMKKLSENTGPLTTAQTICE